MVNDFNSALKYTKTVQCHLATHYLNSSIVYDNGSPPIQQPEKNCVWNKNVNKKRENILKLLI